MKKKPLKHLLSVAAMLSATIFLSSCGGSAGAEAGSSSPQSQSTETVLMGAGSSFDYPLFSKMFYEYHEQFGQKVNYQSVGSGAGISQLSHKTVDFGASDAPMKPEQEKSAGAAVVHIPVTTGAVVLSYYLPEVKGELRFEPELLAQIFLGKITKWNDSRIAAGNKGMSLPDLPIVIAHRSDGSGTTSIFTDYLSKVSREWKDEVGHGSSVKWPVGLGGKGNEGVAALIKQTPGAIGYIELAYAIQNKMPYAAIRNKAGNFIKPTTESVAAAAQISIPNDGKISLTNTDAVNGYPIAGFSWVIIYQELAYGNNTLEKAKSLVTLVSWMIHEGQKYSAPLDYAPLSDEAVTVGMQLLKSVTFKGETVLKQEEKIATK